LPTTSQSSKIQGIQNKIISAQETGKNELTVKELAVIAAKVCTECGIKKENFPDEIMLQMCLKSWNERFKATEDKKKTGMSVQEIILAFEMNINGELEAVVGGKLRKKIEHFHCFSREYFCDVLGAYLDKKKDTLKYLAAPPQEENKQLPPADSERLVLEAIIADYKSWNAEGILIPNLPMRAKFEALLQMFDMPVTEITIIKLRERAAANIISRNAQERLKLDPEKNIGKYNDLLHQSSRLKSGKLLNDKDEQQIRYEVDFLIYTDCFTIYKAAEFEQHVRDNIQLLNQNQ